MPDPDHVHRRFQLVEDRYWIEPDGSIDDVASFQRDSDSRLINAYNVYVLIKFLDEFGPEVVFVNNLVGLGGHGLIATLQFLQIPWVWYLGDAVPNELCLSYRAVFPSLVREFNRFIKGQYIAVSRQLIEELEGYGFALEGNVKILPYGIIGSRSETTTPRERKAGEPLQIMSCGMVNRQKGIDILIEAAALLVKAGHDNFHVDIYGQIEDASLVTLAASSGLARYLSFKGPWPHSELTRIYAQYDIFAFPTREREPFGIVALEAMAAGCVSVMTRRCGIAEWFVHGVHCLKAARNSDAFAETLRAALVGEIPLTPIAARAREVVWKHFHLDAIIPSIEGILIKAVEKNQEGRGGGSSVEVYRLARLAEALAGHLIRQTMREPRRPESRA